MCMHIVNESELDCIIAAIEQMDQEQIARIQEAIKRRRKPLAESNVIERRPFESGVQQLET
jgi:hypothetical protein